MNIQLEMTFTPFEQACRYPHLDDDYTIRLCRRMKGHTEHHASDHTPTPNGPAMNDPRVEAAAAAMRDPKPNQIRYGEDLEEWVDRVMSDALAAADRADREQGIHRVRVDDATVERVARVLAKHAVITDGLEDGSGWCAECGNVGEDNEDHQARAVLAALTGAGS